jgi:hypothetical protein
VEIRPASFIACRHTRADADTCADTDADRGRIADRERDDKRDDERGQHEQRHAAWQRTERQRRFEQGASPGGAFNVARSRSDEEAGGEPVLS